MFQYYSIPDFPGAADFCSITDITRYNKQLLDEVFAISGIIKVEITVIVTCRQVLDNTCRHNDTNIK